MIEAKERAEMLTKGLDQLTRDPIPLQATLREAIAAQISEAEREAVERYKETHPGVARDAVTYQAGWNAARERAKEIAENDICEIVEGNCYRKKIADRIVGMEP